MSDQPRQPEEGSLWRDQPQDAPPPRPAPSLPQTPSDETGELQARIDEQVRRAAEEPVAPLPELPQERQPDTQTAPAPQPTAEPGEPLIRLIGIVKRFGALSVFDGLDLDIHRGQTTVILGPSGVGKSVLLKLVVGLIRPDAGQIFFHGKRVDELPERDLVEVRKKIGFLFQQSALFDSMSVGDNICFPLVQHASEISSDERRARCARVLKMVGLPGVESKMPAELSGGQRKRVALARAIVLEPEVVFYDEPTTGLDPIRADVISELILTLARNLGITSVVVTHDMPTANKIADRMVMIYDGKVVADGTPRAFAATENDLVRRFVTGQADQQELDLIRAGFARATS